MATEASKHHLQLSEITAAQFIDIWKHFDADGRSIITIIIVIMQQIIIFSYFTPE